MLEDKDYAAAAKRVQAEMLAGIAYFSNPEDLVPDTSRASASSTTRS